MKKAVFLDRDGVINQEIGRYIYKPKEFILNLKLIEKLKTLKKEGYIFIVISNQGGISKGIYKKKDVEILENIFQIELSKHNLKIEEFYYCTHHPDIENCICRKPKTSLLEKAIARFNIDISTSFFIGDMDRDIECATNIGIKGIKIDANKIEQITW